MSVKMGVIVNDPAEEFLAHYGVKGMKWGVRRDGPDGVSSRTNRDARKDAEEFARAKMFYGTGAGNRRKLIKATVEAKSKKDPSYKKAFDHHVANQDMGKHASKAKSERRRTDTKESAGKTVRGVHRKLTGQAGNVTLASAVIAGGIVAARQTGADRIILNAAKQQFAQANSRRQDGAAVNDWMRKNGFL